MSETTSLTPMQYLDRAMSTLRDIGLVPEEGVLRVAVIVGKRLASDGVIYPEAYYPVTELAKQVRGIPPELAMAIARQLRLRNLGGIIIIDFIDMEKKSNQEKVFNALSEAFAKDRSKTHILPMSEMGLVQMTRKRSKKPLTRVLCEMFRPAREHELRLWQIEDRHEHGGRPARSVGVAVRRPVAAHLQTADT